MTPEEALAIVRGNPSDLNHCACAFALADGYEAALAEIEDWKVSDQLASNPEWVRQVQETGVREWDALRARVAELETAIEEHVTEFDRIVAETRLRPGSGCGPMLADIVGDLQRALLDVHRSQGEDQ